MRELHNKIKLRLGAWYGLAMTVVLIFAIVALGVGVAKLLPIRNNLSVPFSSQAPAGNWSEPWQSACEETSIIMVDTFYKGGPLTKEEAVQKILDIFKVKQQNFGTSKDESMELVAEIINAAELGWQAHVVVGPTLAQLQTELAAGRPIIAPVDARLLKNPFYENQLTYHVMVISGYDNASGNFIVQDPGTKRGANFQYPFDTFMNAIHDYLPKDIRAGRRAVLFTAPSIQL